jgi:hypothetical protein
MNNYDEVGRVSALLVIVAGLLICFWGYRILKVSLATLGFIAGAFGGWELGVSLANSSTAIALGCALFGGVVGMVLCLWLYFVGIFLIGATAGAVVAAAFFSGIGRQIQPIVFGVLPIAFGVLAVLAQKFMIILSTAFSGAYLIVAGVWPFVANNPNVSRIWLYPSHNISTENLGYGALAFWGLLTLFGIGSQFRASRSKAHHQDQQKLVNKA